MSDQDPTQVVNDIRAKVGPKRRVVFVSGNFNVLHPGHVRLLKFASELADFVVVGVLPDTSSGVTVPSQLRLEGVLSLSIVSSAVVLNVPPQDFIALLKPDVVVKGAECATLDNPELASVESYGGQLVFGSGETQFSSFDLLAREFENVSRSTLVLPMDFPHRHGFSLVDLRQSLARFAGLRVLVVGDLIVDDYITCDALGMSQEDPTIVVTPIETKTFVGGAGVVAAHARGLGGDVTFITVVGRDEAAEYARTWLDTHGITVHAVVDTTRPTTRKQRFRANGKTLLRVNHLRQHAISLGLAKAIVRQVDECLATTDVVLFSDFNYGCLPQGLVEAIASRAEERGVLMAADSQASSQMADISRFKRMALITPTEREARLAVRDTRIGLAILAERLKAAADARNVVVTLGAEGLFILAQKGDGHLADRLPAFNTTPKDVAGAGDSFFTATSMAMCAGVDVWQGIYLGALAAGCQVSRVGNAPLSHTDLLRELGGPA